MRLPGLIISKRRYVMAVLDILLVFVAMWLSIQIKYDYHEKMLIVLQYPEIIVLIVLLTLAVFYLCGFYDHIWRFASINQYLVLFAGTLIQSVLIAAALMWRSIVFPGSVFIIYWMILFLAVTGVRVTLRIFVNRFRGKNSRRIFRYYGKRSNRYLAGESGDSEGKLNLGYSENNIIQADDQADDQAYEPILIMVIGVGHAGSQIIRELQEIQGNRQVIAAIDDNPGKQGFRVRGVPVVGDRHQIINAAKEYKIDEIIFAIPSASPADRKEILELCAMTGCQIRQVPTLSDLIDGRIRVSDIRHVEVSDLLGREQIVLDNQGIELMISGKTVLVTGGGGSIGSEICRQVAVFKPKKLIILDIYENNAYDLQMQLQTRYPDLNLIVLIGSVRDRSRLDRIFARYQPEIIFHAAAHKHVPLMETSPGEAVKNNIFGTYNTALTAARNNAKKFVLISTDKAVNPTNVMGATKRMAEMVIQYMANEFPDTMFAAVRFGNVLGSNGSVIPLFNRQIREEGRVTVTHPDITRYFMTIPEASRLVIQAGTYARGGEIFVLDMGKPVKIVDLARNLIRLSGLEPDVDIPIEYTGLRPGEKMYEELYLDQESFDKTDNQKIFVLRPVMDAEALDYEIETLKELIKWRNSDFDRLINQLRFSYLERDSAKN